MSIIATVKTVWAGWSVGWPIFKKARSGFKGWNAKRKAKKAAKKAAKAEEVQAND